MSSTESSGAPAEATGTPSAPAAAFPTFGSTRGSGLARGKRPAAGPAAGPAASTEYTPTAIEVNAPREYQNPFAPAESAPVAALAPASVEKLPVITPAPVREAAPVASQTPAAVEKAEPAELNILEPAQPKVAPAQTWESEGFKPNRESRGERPRREGRSEQPADEPVDVDSIPPQFLYVRPGHAYIPTPRNWGGAPRERSERPIHGSPGRALEMSATVPAKSGGFLRWLKSLFGGSSSADAVSAPTGGSADHRREGGHRRHRGGRNRGGGGEGRGGRGRGRGGRGGGGYRSEGSSQGGV